MPSGPGSKTARAPPPGVRVLRSALGEIRVFVGEGGALGELGAAAREEADYFAEEFWVEGVSDW